MKRWRSGRDWYAERTGRERRHLSAYGSSTDAGGRLAAVNEIVTQ